jgi:diguanylate cyclase (GGDEF)-like protein
MAAMLEEDDTVEAQSLSTSLDPYGQLLKMLMPRALCIAIYDRKGMPLWLSDGTEGPDLLQFIEEALNSARSGDPDPNEREGFARTWDGDTAYIFILRDTASLLGVVALSCRDGSGGARPFNVLQGLLRPALQVLTRELVSQYNIGDLQKSLSTREGDLELLLAATGASANSDSGDLQQLVANCVDSMDCAFGALLIPERNISLTHSSDASRRRKDGEVLDKVQRHLFAWAQVQRRTLMLNKAPPSNSPFGAVAYKILACPIRHGDQHVAGMLVLFRPLSGADFNVRQVHIAEMMTRKVSYVLLNAYDKSGLLTRPAFEQQVAAALAGGEDLQRHCVIYIDVDRLHTINENHGMHVGDDALSRVAECIRTTLPADACAAGMSGDRFAVFVPKSSLEATRQFTDSLCTQVAQLECTHDGKRIAISISAGIASVPETKYPLTHAIASAESACKSAKDKGRGRVAVHQDAACVVIKRHEDTAMVSALRRAIANDSFRMDAQPIAQIGVEGAPRRYELLLRMLDESGQTVAPDKFFAAAERHLLATDIDRWVVHYALEILSSAAPILQGVGAHFAINLSAQSLGDETFPDYLEARLREYALPPSLLSFEITETAAVANIVRAETLIRRLQTLGHDMALDDFGRGLSSLTYLKSLSVTDLKIDGGLIRDLAGNSRSQAMVTAIVQLARTNKLRTTAECVETEAMLASLNQLGVDFGQGFAIGRPQPLEGVMQQLLRSKSGVSRPSESRIASRFSGS